MESVKVEMFWLVAKMVILMPVDDNGYSGIRANVWVRILDVRGGVL